MCGLLRSPLHCWHKCGFSRLWASNSSASFVTSFGTCCKISQRQYTVARAASTWGAAAVCNQRRMPCLQQVCYKGSGHISRLLKAWAVTLSSVLFLCIMGSQDAVKACCTLQELGDWCSPIPRPYRHYLKQVSKVV